MASFVDILLEKLYQDNGFCRRLEKIENKTGIPRLYLVAVPGILFFLLLVFTIFSNAATFLLLLIGAIYPGYAYWYALEHEIRSEEERWQVYWIVYASFTVLTFFFLDQMFVDVKYVKWLYWNFKVFFLLWCSDSGPNNGSFVIYLNVVQPIFFFFNYINLRETLLSIRATMMDLLHYLMRHGGSPPTGQVGRQDRNRTTGLFSQRIDQYSRQTNVQRRPSGLMDMERKIKSPVRRPSHQGF